jgi:hypothetical protein
LKPAIEAIVKVGVKLKRRQAQMPGVRVTKSHSLLS